MSKANQRAIDGILLLNKPYGLTSNAALQQVKRLYGAKKAGHTGSLDPMATGMLPVCFGEATKFCQYLLDADKCYEVTGLLGVKTNTGDAMGVVTSSTETFDVTQTQLQDVLDQFKGQIKQVPSMFSALKHQGTPLYKYARAGIDIPREARDVSIHRLELINFDGRHFSLLITCSKGTYMRNLIEDIGDQLGVGAHVTQLHRCYTAGFDHDLMLTMDELQQMSDEELLACLHPMDRAVSYLPRMSLSVDATYELRQGKSVKVQDSDVSHLVGSVRLYDDEEHFIGLGEVQALGLLKVKRLLATSGG